ncbi:MAG TPA: CpXC domain-containing protein [Bellilinea sp.]|nr:CpXC domain-containing protein [Bellilinea sp.]
MAKIQTSCPRCKSPVAADVEQLFDMNVDPQAKDKLLSGQVNVINCPTCGYNGMVPTPIVYHDPSKELLLTFVPSEMGLPLNEQERLLGPYINQVMNRLPQEQRKAYLLRPQSMFTFQTMIEKILEADGITKQMIEDQQNRLNLLQRLLTIPGAEDRALVVQQEEALIDANFFSMLGRIIEASAMQGDERGARVLAGIQQELFKLTKVGQEIEAQNLEAQEAVKALQDASKEGLTREKLIDLFVAAAEKPIQLSALASMAYTGMDYEFFRILSERIDQASEEEKPVLDVLRQKLLAFSARLEEQMRNQVESARALVNKIASANDVTAAIQENAQQIDESFLVALQEELKLAREKADLERIAKLQSINTVIEEATAPPPELGVIEEMLEAPSYDERMQIMQAHSEMVTPEFVQMVSQLISQTEAQNDAPEMVEKLKEIHRIALRVSMMGALKN